MKTKIFTTLLIALFCIMLTETSEALSIVDVYTIPGMPTTFDEISIYSTGYIGYAEIPIKQTTVTFSNSSVELDIYFDFSVTGLPVVVPWNYQENIGILFEGRYDLTVNVFKNELLSDTYTTTFDVVPEPASLLFLAVGSLGVCRFSKRHRR